MVNGNASSLGLVKAVLYACMRPQVSVATQRKATLNATNPDERKHSSRTATLEQREQRTATHALTLCGALACPVHTLPPSLEPSSPRAPAATAAAIAAAVEDSKRACALNT